MAAYVAPFRAELMSDVGASIILAASVANNPTAVLDTVTKEAYYRRMQKNWRFG